MNFSIHQPPHLIDSASSSQTHSFFYSSSKSNLCERIFRETLSLRELQCWDLTGIDPYTPDPVWGASPIHLASIRNRVDLLEFFVNTLAFDPPLTFTEKIIKINTTSTKEKFEATALLFACQQGCLEAAEFLIEYGSDIFTKDLHGCTLLHHAAAKGHANIVKMLIQRYKLLENGLEHIDAQTPVHRYTPLHKASMANHSTVVQLLLFGGASTEAETLNKITPLMAAAILGNVESVCSLIRFEANTEVQYKEKSYFDYLKKKNLIPHFFWGIQFQLALDTIFLTRKPLLLNSHCFASLQALTKILENGMEQVKIQNILSKVLYHPKFIKSMNRSINALDEELFNPELVDRRSNLEITQDLIYLSDRFTTLPAAIKLLPATHQQENFLKELYLVSKRIDYLSETIYLNHSPFSEQPSSSSS